MNYRPAPNFMATGINAIMRWRLWLSLALALLSALGLSCERHADGQPPRGSPLERILTEDGREWLNPLPKALSTLGRPEIPRGDIYEVSASQFIYALLMLEGKPAVPVSEAQARGLAGPCFRSEAGR